ncbi:unnamed protein product [Orchesella dallaii]|uniref:DUF4200 domain-containing protein n=1 Tax=Orchesella dallaii TaxID=48710 RepID=A0ABP1QTV1_9HEXA
MELVGGWDRVRRNLVGTFFLQTTAEIIEKELPQPAEVLLERQTNFLPSTELEREYRELEKYDNLLQEARNDYADKQKEFGLRWQLCSEKNELLNSFAASFENYYATSKQKQRADKKINDRYDFDLYEKVREVNRLRKQFDRMNLLKVELEDRLKISEVYRDFMNSVVEESQGEYENVSQVMARYYELKSIRENYVRKTVNQIELAFELEKEMKEMVQQKEMENVTCKTYLSQLEGYRNQLQVSNWRRHDNFNALKDGLKHEMLMTFIPKTGIYNLYMLLCHQMEQPATLQEDEFREQLQFIQKFLKELLKISHRTREFLECPSDVPLASSNTSKKRLKMKSSK